MHVLHGLYREFDTLQRQYVFLTPPALTKGNNVATLINVNPLTCMHTKGRGDSDAFVSITDANVFDACREHI